MKLLEGYVKFAGGSLADIIEKLATGQIKIARLPASEDKQVIRIRYQRVF